MKKKVLGTVLSLIMCLSAMPKMVFADTLYYDVWINGVQFTSSQTTIPCGQGTATYDFSKDELTLNNATIISTVDLDGIEGAIYTMSKMNIVLIGTNTINIPDSPYAVSDGISNYNSELDKYGGDINISGTGSLCINNNAFAGYGIDVGSLTIDMSNDFTINCDYYAIEADERIGIIGDGDVCITTGRYGLFARKIEITGNGDMLIVTSDEYGSLMKAEKSIDDELESGIFISGEGNINIDSRGYGLISRGPVTVSGGKNVTVNANRDAVCAYGWISDGSGDININGKEDGLYLVSVLLGGDDIVIAGTGKFNVSSDEGCAVYCGYSVSIELEGRNEEIRFTSNASKPAVFKEKAGNIISGAVDNSENNPTGIVGGSNLNKFNVVGSPDSSSVVYTLKSFNVIFDMGGHGDAIASQKVFIDNKSEKPSDPKADGWTFGGWYSDKSCTKAFDFETGITADTTVYAKWTCNHTHTEIKNAKAATTSSEGYTGDTCCTDCGATIKSGEAIPSLTPASSGKPSGATPTKAPELDVGDFVDRCYDVALGREADEAGYDSWKSQLNNGQACGA